MCMATELEQRVLDAVTTQTGGQAEGLPPHGLVGVAKWRADSDGPGGSGRWEGGYVCRCGTVFARPADDGGIGSALVLFLDHEARP